MNLSISGRRKELSARFTLGTDRQTTDRPTEQDYADEDSRETMRGSGRQSVRRDGAPIEPKRIDTRDRLLR